MIAMQTRTATAEEQQRRQQERGGEKEESASAENQPPRTSMSLASSFWREYTHVPWYTLLLTAVYPVVCGVWYPNVERLAFLRLDTWSRVQAWRIYTYSLLHAGAVHVASNLVMLWVAGAPLEAAHASPVYAVVHTLGVLHGACGVGWETRLASRAHTMGRPPDLDDGGGGVGPMIAVGASGAVYAMFGAQAANLATFWRRMPLRWVRLATLLTFLGAEIVLWYHFYDEDVSYGGHLGGFVGGVLSGGAMLPLLSLLPPVTFPSFLARKTKKITDREEDEDKSAAAEDGRRRGDETAIVIDNDVGAHDVDHEQRRRRRGGIADYVVGGGDPTVAASLCCWLLLAAYTAAGLGNYFV